MKNDSPLISAIISTYNSEKFLDGKINDLLSQTWADKLEIIIINSGSLQNEDEIVKPYLERYSNIKYIKTSERETIYKAWNRGIAIAKGKFITNANTDDRLRKNAYEVLASKLQDNDKVAMVYGNQVISNIVNETFEELKFWEYFVHPKFSTLRLYSNYFLGSQTMWRSTVHYEDGIFFDEKYEIAGDYDFVCRVAEKHEIKHINDCLGIYYRSPNKQNKEYENFQKTFEETYEIKKKYLARYLSGLKGSQVNRIKIYAKFYSFLPKRMFEIYSGIIRRILPGSPPLSLEYICWLGSNIAEKEGDLTLAIKYCNKFKDKSKTPFINKQNLSLIDKLKDEK
ncbi:MAG TPA: glycosyltransferase [Ignavibacteriaceae bacterium]|nr:glycosyltransferase [Ignavibacteriaceae bacterium]